MANAFASIMSGLVMVTWMSSKCSIVSLDNWSIGGRSWLVCSDGLGPLVDCSLVMSAACVLLLERLNLEEKIKQKEADDRKK